MLAQNFKTAADLQITEEGHTALIQVLAMLERDELAFVRPGRTHLANGFNMSRVWEDGECGSVGCIKGWCQYISHNAKLFNFFDGPRFPPDLVKLFMYADERRYSVTPDQAACALRNYLTLGAPRWDEVLS